MKHITRKTAAPITRRRSFQDPLSDPFIRFMSAGGDGGALGAGGAPAGDPAPAGAPAGSQSDPAPADPPQDPAPSDPPADDEQGSQADDPKLKAARDEAAQNRIKAREAASEKDQLIQTLGKALGLVKDDDEQGKGPDAEALAAQVEKSQTEATEAARELAVYKAAATNGADPSKLLDSRSFLNSIKDVDHGDEKALGAAIKAAVDNNKSFASARVAGASTADTASGPGGGSTPKADMSLADAVAGHYNR